MITQAIIEGVNNELSIEKGINQIFFHTGAALIDNKIYRNTDMLTFPIPSFDKITIYNVVLRTDYILQKIRVALKLDNDIIKKKDEIWDYIIARFCIFPSRKIIIFDNRNFISLEASQLIIDSQFPPYNIEEFINSVHYENSN